MAAAERGGVLRRPRRAGPSAAVCCGYLRFFATRETAGAFAAQHSEAPGRILGQQEARALGEEIFGPLLATG